MGVNDLATVPATAPPPFVSPRAALRGEPRFRAGDRVRLTVEESSILSEVRYAISPPSNIASNIAGQKGRSRRNEILGSSVFLK